MRTLTFFTVLLGASFALLVFTLTVQSLWFDEVYSIWFVNRPFWDAWRTSIWTDQNPHATLYYLLLWGWIKLVGQSDFAVRFLSVGFGLLSLMLSWRLACDWLGARAARLTVLLICTAPYFVWYAQEARQYALYLALAVLSTLCLSRTLTSKTSQRAYAIGYVLSATAMAYTHYFSLIIIAAQCVAGFAITLSWRKRWSVLFVANAAVALLCSPIPFKLLSSEHTSKALNVGGAELSLGNWLQDLVAEFVLRTPSQDVAGPRSIIFLLFGLLAVVGLWVMWRRSKHAAVFSLFVGLGPALAFLVVSIQFVSFTPRYIIYTFVVLLMALAAGLNYLQKLARPLGWAATLACVSCLSWLTTRDLTQPDFQRENWRFTGSVLQANAQPGDAILVFADYIAPVVQHYYTGTAQILPFMGDPYNPAPVFDDAQARAEHTLWVVLSHDKHTDAAPDHKLLDIAYARYPWSYAQYPSRGNIRVLGFSTHWRFDELPTNTQPLNIRFENGLALVGFRVDATQLRASDKISHPPSAWIHVISYWQRWKDISLAGAQPTLRLVSSDGQEWGGDLSRRPNVLDFDPPEKWPADKIIEAHSDVNLNPITPAGDYKLEVRMMKDDQRLHLANSELNFAALTEIRVLP